MESLLKKDHLFFSKLTNKAHQTAHQDLFDFD